MCCSQVTNLVKTVACNLLNPEKIHCKIGALRNIIKHEKCLQELIKKADIGLICKPLNYLKHAKAPMPTTMYLEAL